MDRRSSQERDIRLPERFSFAPFSPSSGKNETENPSEGGGDSDTPGGHGTGPSGGLVNPTVRSHMPTNISYPVNVKM